MANSSIRFEWLKSASKIEYDKGFTPAFYAEMGNVFRKHFSKYVPWDDTNTSSFHLARMVQVRPTKTGATIVYSMKYARPQYTHEEYKHQSSIHPLATHHWGEYCWSSEKSEIVREINKLRKRYSR